ncbi:DUF86 domain-containing protein [candidate division KSB1 bacterium]|nr:DUF86 domain-containing protein [candidate division KSB1 bacterium]
MNRDDTTLIDIAQCARLIIEFKQGVDEAAFMGDFKTQSAILHQLMVMGEAVKRLSPEFRARYSEIPWTLIAGMRDRLIHAYDVVDMNEVWKTVDSDVPDLLAMIEPLLPPQNQ